MKEKTCPVCGSRIVSDDSRKKYCGTECNQLASKVTSAWHVYKENSSLPRSPASLASRYIYARAKAVLMESVMEEYGWNVPDFDRVIADQELPGVDEIQFKDGEDDAK